MVKSVGLLDSDSNNCINTQVYPIVQEC
jgi:hypothetical protein